MTSATLPKRFTADDLLRLPGSVSFELVDGRLVERYSGMEASRVGANIATRLVHFLHNQHLGLLFGANAGYQCFPDAPDKVRKPDVSFIRCGRFPGDRAPEGHSRIAPDLAVEIVSPKDLAEQLEVKVAEYLGVGVPIVWVVNPKTCTVRIHRPRSSSRGPVSCLTSEDVIDGEDVLPGFSCPVRDFFA